MTRYFIVILLAVSLVVPLHAQLTTTWAISENQLDIQEGGRVNTVAVNPMDPNQLIVASETGGLFRSADRGFHWTHVDNFPDVFTQSVAYLPSNPRVIFVTAKADFSTAGGGLWRTDNDGDTWWHVPLAAPGMDGRRLSGYEISIQPGKEMVVVGTSEGPFLGWNQGTQWGYTDAFFGRSDKTVYAVLATNDRFYFGGPSGVRVLNGAEWISPASPRAIRDIHAFGRSPLAGNAYAVDDATHLFFTENGGASFSQINSAPLGGECGGAAFVKPILRRGEFSDSVDIYFSNRCWLYHMFAPIEQTPNGPRVNHGSMWITTDLDHDGPRDLGVRGSSAVLLGTSGGLHRAIDVDVWRFTGGGREGGYNAQQINEVKGQNVGNQRTDLYIGTQDTHLWVLPLGGTISRYPDSAEGHFIELPRHVEPMSDCTMAFVANEQRKKSTPRFANVEPWSDPAGEQGAPAVLGWMQYVQNVRRTHIFNAGLASTIDCGRTWEQYARFGEEPRDLPKLGRNADPNDPSSKTIMYQAYKGALGVSSLLRIEKTAGANAEVIYPEMISFGGLGINPTMFAWYQVYAVDPGNPMHIIAPDVVNQEMMQTTNGGRTWEPIPELKDLVLNSGEFLFRAALNGPAAGEIFPFVTAVSFSPQDPQLVLIGTSEGGIFASSNNGRDWQQIQDSRLTTYVTSFFWENANTVYVSTYGRGLWKLRNRRFALPDTFDDICGKCDVVSDSGSGAPLFDASVLVLDGSILGVSTKDGQLREVFVTPGSSVIFTGDPKDPQDDIAITESDGSDVKELEPLPKGPDGWMATGVVFTSDDKITGAAYSQSELTLFSAAPVEDVKGPTDSPVKGMPYIRLTTSAFAGVPTTLPNEAFELSATDFPAGASYEVLIDDVALKGEVTADPTGAFTTTITAPPAPGYHSVTVRPTGKDTPLDASTFLVKY